MRHGYATVALAVAWIFAACAAAPASAFAQTYPDRSVRIIIAFAAGGTIDTLGRIVAQKLSEAWGQSVFVENRPGASGNIGAALILIEHVRPLRFGGFVIARNVVDAAAREQEAETHDHHGNAGKTQHARCVAHVNRTSPDRP